MDNLEKIEIYKKGIASQFVDDEFKEQMRSKISELEGGGENEQLLKSELIFNDRFDAEEFAKAWSRRTLRGHVIGAGENNVKVSIDKVTKEDKAWIDNYVSTKNINKTTSPQSSPQEAIELLQYLLPDKKAEEAIELLGYLL